MIFEQSTKIKIIMFVCDMRKWDVLQWALYNRSGENYQLFITDSLRCFLHKHCCDTRCPGRQRFHHNIPEQTDRQTTSLTPQPSKYHHAIHKSTWPRLNIDPNLPGQQDKRRVSTMYRTRKRRRPAAPASNRQACEKRCVDYANQFQVKLCVFMRAQ